MKIVSCLRCVQLFGLPNDGCAPGCPGPYMCAICGYPCGLGLWNNGKMPAVRTRVYPKQLRCLREDMRDSPPRLERGEGIR